MDYIMNTVIITTDAHRFLALYPAFQKTLELWSYKRHWAPTEHELQKKSVQKDKKKRSSNY